MRVNRCKIRRLLLPPQARGFTGKRWLEIGLRTAHLLGMAGVGGGFLYGAPVTAWKPYFWLLLGSGVAMLLLQVWSNAIWLVQLRGLVILLKVGLLATVALWPVLALPVLLAVVAISGVFAHAPGRVRYHIPGQRRR